MKIRADIQKCCSSGMCAARAPEIFGQREEDGVVQVLQPSPAPELFQSARDAAAGCPVQAIEVHDL